MMIQSSPKHMLINYFVVIRYSEYISDQYHMSFIYNDKNTFIKFVLNMNNI